MDGINSFMYLASDAALFLLVYWPGAVLVILGGMTALHLAARGPKERFHGPALMSLAQLVVPAAILVCGVWFRWDESKNLPKPKWPDSLLPYLLWGHAPITAALLIRYWRAWLFILAVGLAVLGYSVAAVAISGMAVTGDWP